MSDHSAEIGNVLYPAANLDEAVAFYRDGLGLAVKFQDGDRFAALDGGRVTFALASDAEDVAGGVAAVSFKVEDVAAAVHRLVAVGGTVATPPAQGPHEVRAVVRDPSGHAVIVYGPV